MEFRAMDASPYRAIRDRQSGVVIEVFVKAHFDADTRKRIYVACGCLTVIV